MDAILSYSLNKEDDYYTILGCSELSTTEQIYTEFKSKAKLCHPDKVPEDVDAATKFQTLQRAKEVLCDEASRRNYDRWHHSGLCMSYDSWRALPGHHASMHWAPSKRSEPMIEDVVTSTQDNNSAKNEDSYHSYSETRSASVWQQSGGTSSSQQLDSALSRFRNYEI